MSTVPTMPTSVRSRLISRYSARPMARSPLKPQRSRRVVLAGFTRAMTAPTLLLASSARLKSAPTIPVRMTTTAVFPSALW